MQAAGRREPALSPSDHPTVAITIILQSPHNPSCCTGLHPARKVCLVLDRCRNSCASGRLTSIWQRPEIAESHRIVLISLCPQATARCDPHALGCNAGTFLRKVEKPPRLGMPRPQPHRGIGLAALGAVLAGFECRELGELRGFAFSCPSYTEVDHLLADTGSLLIEGSINKCLSRNFMALPRQCESMQTYQHSECLFSAFIHQDGG